VGRDSPQKVGHMAVDLDGPQPRGAGWPVRLSAGSASARSAATDSGRASRRGPPRASRYCDGCRHRPVSRAHADRRATGDGRAREAGGGGFGSGAARIQHRPLGGRLCRRRPEPIPAVAGRSSGSNTSPPAAAAATSRLRHRPLRPSFGFEHGRRLRRRAWPVRPGLGRFAAAGGRRATRPLPTARPRRLGGRELRPGARASQGRRLVTRCGSLCPAMGTV
jgi:hypothetical protein